MNKQITIAVFILIIAGFAIGALFTYNLFINDVACNIEYTKTITYNDWAVSYGVTDEMADLGEDIDWAEEGWQKESQICINDRCYPYYTEEGGKLVNYGWVSE